jgi:hypothetical protein
MLAALLGAVAGAVARAQTYPMPALGEFGGAGPFSVAVNTFTNPIYPTASGGDTLVVSVYHPTGPINPALPTIFFAHGYTTPIGNANNYLNILNNLASWGYNVVFSPYEGGASPNIPLRFDELATGFEAAVTNYNLNTTRVGFAGHSYGGGFLPSMILHEMMGKADLYRAGHFWGGTAAFFYAMAAGYVYSGGGQTGVTVPQAISFPTNLNVIEQVFADDTTIDDPRVPMDVFYNITTPNSQKDFIIVHGESHGTNTVVANHFLPNALTNADTPLQAWAILRRLDALAAWTFAGDTNARPLALGNGVATQIYEGIWSDQTPVAPLDVTDIPDPTVFPSSYVVINWNSAANPRPYALFSGPPVISSIGVSAGRVLVTVTNLLMNHNYIEQQTTDLSSANWSNAISFAATSGESASGSTRLTNTVGSSRIQFWRIVMP